VRLVSLILNSTGTPVQIGANNRVVGMRSLFIVLAILALTSCKPEEQRLDSGLEGYDPHLVEDQRAACLEKGGRFGKAGVAGTFLCYENTRDGYKSCQRGSDCEGLCLARSRSCAPVKPLFGCNDVLTDNGLVSTVCID